MNSSRSLPSLSSRVSHSTQAVLHAQGTLQDVVKHFELDVGCTQLPPISCAHHGATRPNALEATAQSFSETACMDFSSFHLLLTLHPSHIFARMTGRMPILHWFGYLLPPKWMSPRYISQEVTRNQTINSACKVALPLSNLPSTQLPHQP